MLYQDEFTGPLIFMANRTMDTLMTKYTVKPISYDGFVRIETSPYPESAVREAVMNAIVHNDYSSHVPIQIKVFREGLTIYNEGGLLVGWTLDRLMGQHKSLPRNPTLASVFYRAGLIEAFGRGIEKIMSQFEGRHEFDPVFEADSGFSVTFKMRCSTKPTHVRAPVVRRRRSWGIWRHTARARTVRSWQVQGSARVRSRGRPGPSAIGGSSSRRRGVGRWSCVRRAGPPEHRSVWIERNSSPWHTCHPSMAYMAYMMYEYVHCLVPIRCHDADRDVKDVNERKETIRPLRLRG